MSPNRYNPVLWSVPKGSYASDPSGALRILEFRKMVQVLSQISHHQPGVSNLNDKLFTMSYFSESLIQALNRIGLRVVLDVVYNHVSASGPHDESSVLEKVSSFIFCFL